VNPPPIRRAALWGLRLLAAFLLAFWAAFLLLPLASLGGVHPGRSGTAALALAAVVVPLGYLVLVAGRRAHRPPPTAKHDAARHPFLPGNGRLPSP
jgi:hypothetical protein